MPRSRTTEDAFTALAEPRRRQIVELLAGRGGAGLAVGALVLAMGIPQPAVSKHLGVLREVGVVTVVKEGKQRVYHLDAEKLKSVYDWIKMFEGLWTHQLDRIKARAEANARQATFSRSKPQAEKGKAPHEHD